LSLYLSAAVNLIPRFSYYPAPPKDPVLYEVKWVALAIMLGVMVLSAALLLRLEKGIPLELKTRRPVALAVLSALSMAVYLWNLFVLLFLLPALYLWPLMGPRRSLPGRVANLGLFLCGGLVLFLGLPRKCRRIFIPCCAKPAWAFAHVFLRALPGMVHGVVLLADAGLWDDTPSRCSCGYHGHRLRDNVWGQR
jgi:hypothetical protein